jgi:DNA replication protein DnaC
MQSQQPLENPVFRRTKSHIHSSTIPPLKGQGAKIPQLEGLRHLTGALLDRLTHHVHILEMKGDSYRLKQSRRKRDPANS